MDGKPEYTVNANGYEAHFCSKACCDLFQKNPEEVIATTEIPESKE